MKNSSQMTVINIGFEYWYAASEKVAARLVIQNVPSNTSIRRAYKKGEIIVSVAKVDYEITPYGNVPYLWFGIGDRESLSSGVNVFFTAILFTRAAYKNEEDWLKLLSRQKNLYVSLRLGNNEEAHIRILESQGISDWLNLLSQIFDTDVAYNSSKAKYFVTQKVSRQIEGELFSKAEKVYGDSPISTFFSLWAINRLDNESRNWLKKAIADFSRDNTNPIEGISQSIGRSYDEIFSLQSTCEAENVFADWVYYLVSEKHTNSILGGALIRLNLFDESKPGATFRPIPYYEYPISPAEVLEIARVYRFFVLHDFKELIDFKTDFICPVTESLCRFGVGISPTPKNQKFVMTTLMSTVVEQEFFIDSPVSILVGTSGCREIIYIPFGDDLYAFKVVLERFNGINNVLAGTIEPSKGLVNLNAVFELDAPYVPYIELLKTIAALGYRDLVIARYRFQNEAAATKVRSGFSREAKPRIKDPIRLLPRIKRIGTASNALSVQAVEDAVKKIAPHYRSATTRRLPEGHKASETQMEEAAKRGWKVPDGSTFVKHTWIGINAAEQSDSMQKYKSLSLLELFFNHGEPS